MRFARWWSGFDADSGVLRVMTQTVAWRSFQPIGDRKWWGVDAPLPLEEISDAIDAGVLDAPDEIPSRPALSAVPTEAGTR